jgi:hypothetical protein
MVRESGSRVTVRVRVVVLPAPSVDATVIMLSLSSKGIAALHYAISVISSLVLDCNDSVLRIDVINIC